MMNMPRRLAVLISGGGTNLQALIDACNTPRLPHTDIVLVLSNRKSAHGLVRATSATPPIPTAYLALQPYLRANPNATRTDYDLAVAREIVCATPDVVVCAGWMHIVSEPFLDVFREGGIPVINIHPALPGQFDGAHALERGFDAFQRGEIDRLGVMVHRVIAQVDRGAPILVREVEVQKGEELGEYEQRVHHTEWDMIVEATRIVLDQVKPIAGTSVH